MRVSREMDATQRADLDAALTFVIERMVLEAERSAAPLDGAEVQFLRDLPRSPTDPIMQSAWFSEETGQWPTQLRDFQFEKLCKLAKDARNHDLESLPDGERQWKFAAAVLQFNHHPMSWLLGWAGIKTRQVRVISDGLLLIVTATFVVISAIAAAIVLSVVGGNLTKSWQLTVWIAGGILLLGIYVFVYFGARRVEQLQERKTVERYRCDLLGRYSESCRV